MNCREWEERIALYLGGDLPAAEAAEVERHIADCAGCQVFASGLRRSLELLREAHGQPLADAHFAAVRARVMAEIGRGRARWWRVAVAWGLAAAAVVLVILLAGRVGRTPPQMRPPVVATVRPAPVNPDAKIEETPLVKPVHQARHGHPRVRPHPHQPERVLEAKAEPLLVKLVTDDPDVVIYWIAERRGDSK